MRQLKIIKQVTNRDTPSLDKYLQEISKLEMITADEEVELAKKIRQGDQVALTRLVSANLRFVVSVAKQYQSQGLGLPDLINEGNLGLIKAALRFDETRGFKFISYAVWWIRQSILQALAEQARIVRLPLNKIGSINRINKAFAKLEQKFEREPTIDELATTLDMRQNEIKEYFKSSGKHVSMDAPVHTDDDGDMYEVLSVNDDELPDKALISISLQKEVERILTTLSEREAEIVKLFYGLGETHPWSLEEIAGQFGLTRERVRQIKEKAIRRLKHISKSKLLRTYLGS